MISDVDLIERYRMAAVQHGKATAEGDCKAGNKAHDVIAGAYRELRARGTSSQKLLLPLLDDADCSVRIWAASHALEFAPDVGMPVLEALANAKGIGIQRLNAEMTLREWRKGALKFP
jgi:hypothetical protein